MSLTYLRRARAQPSAAPGPETQAGPSVDRLAAGAAPSAEQMGRRVDLPEQIREKMESSFGADFSNVKLYESQTVADAGARAVTRGANIAFAPGELELGTTAGQALLGHELSHVVSQSRGESAGRGFLNDPGLEAQADAQGMMAARGESVYSGPVTPIGASSAMSASGPMQAKKKVEASNETAAKHANNIKNREEAMNHANDQGDLLTRVYESKNGAGSGLGGGGSNTNLMRFINWTAMEGMKASEIDKMYSTAVKMQKGATEEERAQGKREFAPYILQAINTYNSTDFGGLYSEDENEAFQAMDDLEDRNELGSVIEFMVRPEFGGTFSENDFDDPEGAAKAIQKYRNRHDINKEQQSNLKTQSGIMKMAYEMQRNTGRAMPTDLSPYRAKSDINRDRFEKLKKAEKKRR